MRRAVLATAPAIAASVTTVILALLTLLLAVFGSDQAIGVAGAIGITTAVTFALVVLPAALVVCPRGISWPLVPRADHIGPSAAVRDGRVWRRTGAATARRPWPVIVGAAIALGALSAGTASTGAGLSQTSTFRTHAESVDGQKTLARAFPAGAANPTVIITPPAQADAVATTARTVPGVASVTAGETTSSLASLDVALSSAPDTPASYDTVRLLRSAVG